MNITDITKNVNTYISDSSTDRISASDRYQAITEATSWLLEELGNEHMVDRATIEYLPTVTWYKMDSLTPYLLTAGQLRLKNDESDRTDFTRVEARDLASMPSNRFAYAIERYNDASYVGIKIPIGGTSGRNAGDSMDLIGLNDSDELTYTGINAAGIVKEADAIRFDMDDTNETASGLSTTADAIDLTNYSGLGTLIFEIEIPDMEDVNSVSLKFGDNLTTDYWLGTVTQDVNGNPLVEGINTISIPWRDLTVVGSPDVTEIVAWSWTVNHELTKPVAEGFKLSDMRIAKPIDLTFKYIFYRVGKTAAGVDITEFTADTDIPFFAERYPQYRYAVAHKAAAVLYRSMIMDDKAKSEDKEANNSLERYRKNFSGERDMGSSSFKIAGVNLRGRNRVIRRR